MSKKLYIGNIELATAADLQAVEARILKLFPEGVAETENQLIVTSTSGLKAVDPVEFLSDFLSKSLNQEQFEKKDGVVTLKAVDAQIVQLAGGVSLETTLTQFATKEDVNELKSALSWDNLDA